MGQLMIDGLKAMVLGMGMVYVFLLVMIALMNGMSKLLAPYAGMLEKAPASAKKKTPAKKAGNKLSEADTVLARAAVEAVKMHRGGK